MGCRGCAHWWHVLHSSVHRRVHAMSWHVSIHPHTRASVLISSSWPSAVFQ